MSEAVAVRQLSKAQARVLTNEIKADAEKLAHKLLHAYEGGAHLALGYSDWGDYFETEYGKSRSRGYQILEAGRVMDALNSADAPVQELGLNEEQARALTPLVKEPEKVREAWAETKRRAEVEERPITGALVREVVTDFKPGMKTELKKAGLSRRPSVQDAASRVVREAVKHGGVYHVPVESMRQLMLALGKE